MSDPDVRQRPGTFVAHVNVVLLTYALDGVLALATAVLIARALGPEGRGAFGLFMVSAALGQLVLGLGIGNAAIYYINRRELPLRDAVSAVHVVAIAAIVPTAVAVALTLPWADDLLGGRVNPWLFVPAVPLLLYANLLKLLLQALSRFVDLGMAVVGQQALMLAAVATAFALAEPSPSDIVLFMMGATAASAAFSLVRVGVRHVHAPSIARPRFGVIGRLARFGVQGEAGNVLQQLNYRFDQYIVQAFVGLSAVGIYAVGVSMTEALFVLANAVALVLMPRLTSEDDETVAWMTPVASRNTMLIAAGGALALAVVAPIALPAFFGDAFDDSVQALWWLLPGTVALTGSKVLTSYIFSRGRPLVNTGITLAALVVTLVADLALVPPFGVNGAAAASSIAYCAHLCVALYAYRRISGRSVREAVLPVLSDAQLYVDAARDVLARIARRPALPARG
jgi:O-antigen/teichoic acid export membrane protein